MSDTIFDAYFDFNNCVNRLYDEWLKHPKLIVACDFDDTVFDFHQKNQSHEMVLDLLRKCKELGFYVVIFSASKPERHGEMCRFLRDRRIIVDEVNKNPIELPYGNHGKIFYNILLDDRAGLWEAVRILTAVIAKIETNKNEK